MAMWKQKSFDNQLFVPYNQINQNVNVHNDIILHDNYGHHWINVEAIKNDQLLMKFLKNK